MGIKLACLGSKPSTQSHAESHRSGPWLKSSSSQAWARWWGYCPPPIHTHSTGTHADGHTHARQPHSLGRSAGRTGQALTSSGSSAQPGSQTPLPGSKKAVNLVNSTSLYKYIVYSIDGATVDSSSTNTVKKKSKMTLNTNVFLPFQTKLLFWYYKPFFFIHKSRLWYKH